jgi:hypothetical protein
MCCVDVDVEVDVDVDVNSVVLLNVFIMNCVSTV